MPRLWHDRQKKKTSTMITMGNGDSLGGERRPVNDEKKEKEAGVEILKSARSPWL